MTLVRERHTRGGKTYEYWVVRWRAPDGRKRGRSLGGTHELSKRQARKLMLGIAQEVAQSGGFGTEARLTLQKVADDFLIERRASVLQSTVRQYEIAIRDLLVYFGRDRRICTITPADARLYRPYLLKTQEITDNTANLRIRIAKVMFRQAHQDGLISRNPFEDVSAPARPIGSWRYVPPSEYYLMRDKAGPDLSLAISLARLAALRFGEVWGLEWRDVQENMLLVQRQADRDVPKDKESRQVPLCRELMTILGQVPRRAGECRVLPPTPRQTVQNRLLALRKRCGIAAYPQPWHALRKSCIMDWARLFPAHVVKEWSGHARLDTMDQYYLQVLGSDVKAGSSVHLLPAPVSTENGTEKPNGHANVGSQRG